MKPAREIGKLERTFDLPVHRSTGRKRQKNSESTQFKIYYACYAKGV